MDKLSKEKIAALKMRHAKTRAIVFKCSLCIGIITGVVVSCIVRKKLMSEQLCSKEDRLFYKERCIEIKNALKQIKEHYTKNKTS